MTDDFDSITRNRFRLRRGRRAAAHAFRQWALNNNLSVAPGTGSGQNLINFAFGLTPTGAVEVITHDGNSLVTQRGTALTQGVNPPGRIPGCLWQKNRLRPRLYRPVQPQTSTHGRTIQFQPTVIATDGVVEAALCPSRERRTDREVLPAVDQPARVLDRANDALRFDFARHTGRPMKSPKARIALRALVAMGAPARTGFSIQDLARSEGIPLWKFWADPPGPQNGGLLRNKRGVGGGYQLVAKPARITLGEVVTIFDGSFDPLPAPTDEAIGRVFSGVARASGSLVSRNYRGRCDRTRATGRRR